MFSGITSVSPQGDLGPFNPGLSVDVPVWLALNLKQRQKCRIMPPAWMDVGKIYRAYGSLIPYQALRFGDCCKMYILL